MNWSVNVNERSNRDEQGDDSIHRWENGLTWNLGVINNVLKKNLKSF